MTHLKITDFNNDTVKATMTDGVNFSIPLRITGKGLNRFYKNSDGEKEACVFPDLIHISKNNNVTSSMKDIKVTQMFGKTLIQGTSTKDWETPVVIDVGEIKEMWNDSYSSRCDVWTIEL